MVVTRPVIDPSLIRQKFNSMKIKWLYSVKPAREPIFYNMRGDSD